MVRRKECESGDMRAGSHFSCCTSLYRTSSAVVVGNVPAARNALPNSAAGIAPAAPPNLQRKKRKGKEEGKEKEEKKDVIH